MKSTKKYIWISGGLFIIFLFGVIGLPYIYLSGNRTYQEVSIPADGYQLNGYLNIGSDPEGLWIVLAHGNRKAGQSHELYQQIRGNLPGQVSVLAIDFRGFGGSSAEGLENGDDIINRIVDIEAAVKYLNDNYDVMNDQIVLIGHSLGASRVMRAALDHNYRIVIPIGLGNWDSLLANPDRIENYRQKIYNNTGVFVSSDRVIIEGEQFSSEILFSECPESPVWLVFASRDDGREPLSPSYREAHNRCGQDLQWSVIPFSNHMYGTESARFPKILTRMVSRIYISFLMMRLDNILENA